MVQNLGSLFTQPSGQLAVGEGVVAIVVMETPSARFLQMYFSRLLQLTTSHNPACMPVVMATQPFLLSLGARNDAGSRLKRVSERVRE